MKLNNVNFHFLGSNKWDEILSRTLISFECNNYSFPSKLFLRVLAEAFFSYRNDWNFSTAQSSKILFVGSSLDRMSNKDTFISISNLVDSDLLYSAKHARTFELLRGLFILMVCFPLWFIQLKKCGYPFRETLILMFVLKSILDFKSVLGIQKVDLAKYKAVVFFYDSLPEESYLVHLCKSINVFTATLMHGQFVARREKIMENCGLEYRTSFSDNFLCWNTFSKDEAIIEGLHEDKLIVLGIPSYVKSEFTKCINPNNGVFGVVLTHPTFEEENLKLIKAANSLAQKTGKKFILKLHPNYDVHYFDKYISKEYYLGNAAKGISILDYANSVEFSIVGSSSVYVELIYVYHNIIRFSSGRNDDKFRDITVGAIFNNHTPIYDAFSKGFSDNDKEFLFDKLCSVKNVKKSYYNYLNNLV